MAGSGRGPDSLHQQAEKIRVFMGLPQFAVPVLNVAKKNEEAMNEQEKDAWLSRWMSCQGLAPRPSPPLYEYDWLEPPQGAMLPPPRTRPLGPGPGQMGGYQPQPYREPFGAQAPMYPPQQF